MTIQKEKINLPAWCCETSRSFFLNPSQHLTSGYIYTVMEGVIKVREKNHCYTKRHIFIFLSVTSSNTLSPTQSSPGSRSFIPQSCVEKWCICDSFRWNIVLEKTWQPSIWTLTQTTSWKTKRYFAEIHLRTVSQS